MWRTVLQRRAYACLQPLLESSHPFTSKFPLELPLIQSRALSRPPRTPSSAKPPVPEESLPEPPPLSNDDIDFFGELARTGEIGTQYSEFDGLLDGSNDSRLPEAPHITSDWDRDFIEAEYDDTKEVEDLDPVPYFPPIKKFSIQDGVGAENKRLITGLESAPSAADVNQSLLQNTSTPLEMNPELERILAAWSRAVLPSPVNGPLPLHELANRSTKIKQLVKLGVDMYKIAGRHGDLEKLTLLDWERQIKPQIRFLVDIGIRSERLGEILSRNTELLWTDKDDIQVRLNYLEAKMFSPEQIKNIVNGGVFWLTLPTKEIDRRLGFIQKTFHLTGSDVRILAASYPSVVSSQKWKIFVDTTKLLDREFGFNKWERKTLLMTTPQCYLRPTVFRRAFDFCHNQIGLTHTQLVQHATLLLNRVNEMKPRYEFLKFLKRDIFNAKDPLYISPDWLWKGTVEEFCEKAAKVSVEDFENYLRYSDHT